MIQANIHDAKTNLSHLVKCAAEGEQVIIAKHGKPYVQIVPLDKPSRKPGRLAAFFAENAVPDLHQFDAGNREIESEFEGW
ncbi:type II toxin-antitoxin system Phd/YefM family antitoxin [Neisseria chenwenguii]|uniref:Antitoxin n=1 Tax=Neisseria chenwenguii TaxID=1853278 RepID=A0A220S3S0_9NEIS|nr:type II toxin-antitoxin system prevent-host-death family antitoxin [Neisseria chenwenguii]ASK27855.1 prevent-host-death protein [Neisseria chenwenguii]ROV56460.1 type II toxin-antitoxin system Phd/YefM family antitoxin [Neisseria chenwenguii]